MAPRSKQNHEARFIKTEGPNHRKDVCNPQMGGYGTDRVLEYTSNDNGDTCTSGLTDSGVLKTYNDGTIEMVAGVKGVEGGIDFKISAMNGDITITCMKNGAVRITGANIMITADEDVDIKAGRNITMDAKSGRILLNSNKADVKALAGNLAEATTGSFVSRIFDSSFVGMDFLQSVGAITGIGGVPAVVANIAGGLLFPTDSSSGIGTT